MKLSIALALAFAAFQGIIWACPTPEAMARYKINLNLNHDQFISIIRNKSEPANQNKTINNIIYNLADDTVTILHKLYQLNPLQVFNQSSETVRIRMRRVWEFRLKMMHVSNITTWDLLADVCRSKDVAYPSNGSMTCNCWDNKKKENSQEDQVIISKYANPSPAGCTPVNCTCNDAPDKKMLSMEVVFHEDLRCLFSEIQ